jgi:acyl carrier protein
MSEEEVRAGVLEILHRIAPEADLDQLDPNQNLREALDIDSFDFLNVLVGVSEKLGVNIPEAEYRRVSTLKGLIEYVNRFKEQHIR